MAVEAGAGHGHGRQRRALNRRVPRRGALTAMLIVVVTLGFVSSNRARAGGKNIEGVVNLNTAPFELLSLLPGIGPSKARGIVTYRTRRPFRTVDELVRVKGIGRRMVREMRPHLAVAGPSTARGVAGARNLAVAAPVPPPPPPAARPACRPVVVTPLRKPLNGLARGRPFQPVRSPANHCAPPA